uniref:INO80 complex subunit C n=1 Tax=Eptatretus burgeri TaxID=7764 RepID=A0A8C4QPI2_EPTBU
MAASPGFPVRPRGKKRPNSPGSARPGEPPAGKKRKTVGVEGNFEAQELVEITAEMSTELPPKSFPFKDPNFTHSSLGGPGVRKSRVWKNLKQILTAERNVGWNPNLPTCTYIRFFWGEACHDGLKTFVFLSKKIVGCRWVQISCFLSLADSNIEAPPSFKPAKKYSDLTGLIAPYSDPLTKLRFATAEEFSRLRSLPPDVAAGYLALRKAHALIA